MSQAPQPECQRKQHDAEKHGISSNHPDKCQRTAPGAAISTTPKAAITRGSVARAPGCPITCCGPLPATPDETVAAIADTPLTDCVDGVLCHGRGSNRTALPIAELDDGWDISDRDDVYWCPRVLPADDSDSPEDCRAIVRLDAVQRWTSRKVKQEYGKLHGDAGLESEGAREAEEAHASRKIEGALTEAAGAVEEYLGSTAGNPIIAADGEAKRQLGALERKG